MTDLSTAPHPSFAGLGGLVDDYLRQQYERIAWGDLSLRRGENVVHKTRVAVRRTRSTLRVFGSLFDADEASALDTELAWYADQLGRVRDLDVIRRTLESDLGTDPEGLFDPDATARLLGILDAERDRAWGRLRAVLDEKRYRALRLRLDRWRDRPPFAAGAQDGAGTVDDYLRRARKKADKRLRKARAAAEVDADRALHRARKAAKRARYAAELARPELGKPAKRMAKAYEERQESLGANQDHVTVIALLRAAAASKAGAEIGFLCGVLAQRHVTAKAALR